MRSYILPVIAVLMIAFAAKHVLSRQVPIQQGTPPNPPPASSSGEVVAGAGIVEPCSENILIGSNLTGVVHRVFVRVGQQVAPETPLFELDPRQIEADIAVKKAALIAAESELNRLNLMPRPEEIPPVVAQRKQAEAFVAEMYDQAERFRKLRASGASTEEQVVSSQTKLANAQAALEYRIAEEKKVLAGAWDAEKAVAQAKIRSAQSEVDQLDTELKRSTTTAPRISVQGKESKLLEVLQVNVRPGEYITSTTGNGIMVLGDTSKKYIRVDIDEHDIPRFNPKYPATAIVRGENNHRFQLAFVRVEPYVIPKRSLTGDNRERVDTRVLQVIYEIQDDPAAHTVYVGQQMDVFVDVESESQENSTTD
ncbi:HlyD family secretion protein [Planctomicrobium sp. SH668]|uniref:HlyD family secretion protein n=1 Tax=Planctomicrobium sp. SH668 TaxID=3448126 RepID=UPI003F5CA6AE